MKLSQLKRKLRGGSLIFQSQTSSIFAKVKNGQSSMECRIFIQPLGLTAGHLGGTLTKSKITGAYFSKEKQRQLHYMPSNVLWNSIDCTELD
jgi:hypothetical protein